MLWRVDSDLLKNKRLCRRPSSLRILFGRVYLTDAWAADYKTHRTHKKPCNGFLTAASIAASKDFKTTACRADLMYCCVLLPKFQLLLQKKLLRNFCVERRSRHLVICSNATNEQARGHTKVLPCVLRQYVWDEKSELRRSCCRNAQVASLHRITQHQLLRLCCFVLTGLGKFRANDGYVIAR